MKYDDASWHYGGDFPSDLPDEAGATHIAMFAAWAVLNGLAGEYHIADSSLALHKLEQREITPTSWFWEVCDGKLTDQDLSEQGNRFAEAYYGAGDGFKMTDPSFLNDYDGTFPAASSLYHVEDGWASFDKIAPTLQRRFDLWQQASE